MEKQKEPTTIVEAIAALSMEERFERMQDIEKQIQLLERTKENTEILRRRIDTLLALTINNDVETNFVQEVKQMWDPNTIQAIRIYEYFWTASLAEEDQEEAESHRDALKFQASILFGQITRSKASFDVQKVFTERMDAFLNLFEEEEEKEKEKEKEEEEKEKEKEKEEEEKEEMKIEFTRTEQMIVLQEQIMGLGIPESSEEEIMGWLIELLVITIDGRWEENYLQLVRKEWDSEFIEDVRTMMTKEIQNSIFIVMLDIYQKIMVDIDLNQFRTTMDELFTFLTTEEGIPFEELQENIAQTTDKEILMDLVIAAYVQTIKQKKSRQSVKDLVSRLWDGQAIENVIVQNLFWERETDDSERLKEADVRRVVFKQTVMDEKGEELTTSEKKSVSGLVRLFLSIFGEEIEEEREELEEVEEEKIVRKRIKEQEKMRINLFRQIDEGSWKDDESEKRELARKLNVLLIDLIEDVIAQKGRGWNQDIDETFLEVAVGIEEMRELAARAREIRANRTFGRMYLARWRANHRYSTSQERNLKLHKANVVKIIEFMKETRKEVKEEEKPIIITKKKKIRKRITVKAEEEIKDMVKFVSRLQKVTTNDLNVLLNKRYNPNFEFEGGMTLLMKCVLAMRPDLIEVLVDHGINVDIRDDRGFTALEQAVQFLIKTGYSEDLMRIIRTLVRSNAAVGIASRMWQNYIRVVWSNLNEDRKKKFGEVSRLLGMKFERIDPTTKRRQIIRRKKNDALARIKEGKRKEMEEIDLSLGNDGEVSDETEARLKKLKRKREKDGDDFGVLIGVPFLEYKIISGREIIPKPLLEDMKKYILSGSHEAPAARATVGEFKMNLEWTKTKLEISDRSGKAIADVYAKSVVLYVYDYETFKDMIGEDRPELVFGVWDWLLSSEFEPNEQRRWGIGRAAHTTNTIPFVLYSLNGNYVIPITEDELGQRITIDRSVDLWEEKPMAIGRLLSLKKKSRAEPRIMERSFEKIGENMYEHSRRRWKELHKLDRDEWWIWENLILFDADSLQEVMNKRFTNVRIRKQLIPELIRFLKAWRVAFIDPVRQTTKAGLPYDESQKKIRELLQQFFDADDFQRLLGPFNELEEWMALLRNSKKRGIIKAAREFGKALDRAQPLDRIGSEFYPQCSIKQVQIEAWLEMPIQAKRKKEDEDEESKELEKSEKRQKMKEEKEEEFGFLTKAGGEVPKRKTVGLFEGLTLTIWDRVLESSKKQVGKQSTLFWQQQVLAFSLQKPEAVQSFDLKLLFEKPEHMEGVFDRWFRLATVTEFMGMDAEQLQFVRQIARETIRAIWWEILAVRTLIVSGIDLTDEWLKKQIAAGNYSIEFLLVIRVYIGAIFGRAASPLEQESLAKLLQELPWTVRSHVVRLILNNIHEHEFPIHVEHAFVLVRFLLKNPINVNMAIADKLTKQINELMPNKFHQKKTIIAALAETEYADSLFASNTHILSKPYSSFEEIGKDFMKSYTNEFSEEEKELFLFAISDPKFTFDDYGGSIVGLGMPIQTNLMKFFIKFKLNDVMDVFLQKESIQKYLNNFESRLTIEIDDALWVAYNSKNFHAFKRLWDLEIVNGFEFYYSREILRPFGSILHFIIMASDSEFKFFEIIAARKDITTDFLQGEFFGQRLLPFAADEGRLDIVQTLVENGFPVDQVGEDGITALHGAIVNADKEMVRYLLKKKADPYLQIDSSKPIFTALIKNNGTFEIMLEENVDVNDSELVNWMIKNGHSIEKILPLINVNMASETGETLIVKAILQNNSKVFSLLLDNPKVNLKVKTKLQFTLLHTAAIAYLGNKFILPLLNKGLDANARDYTDSTPLHYLATDLSITTVDAVKLLVDRGAKIDAQDNQNQTPLLKSIHYQNYAVAVQLLSYGPEKAGINIQDNHGRTPLHTYFMTKPSYVEDVDVARMKKKLLKLLLKDAKLDLTNELGQTFLHYTAGKGILIPVVSIVVAVLNIQDVNGDTALHVATKKGFFQTTQDLIRMGADPNIANNNNTTPLHLAMIHNLDVVFEYKGELNVNIQEIDSKDTPLHKATRESYLKGVSNLLGRVASVHLHNKDNKKPLDIIHNNNVQFLYAAFGHGEFPPPSPVVNIRGLLHLIADISVERGLNIVIKQMIDHLKDQSILFLIFVAKQALELKKSHYITDILNMSLDTSTSSYSTMIETLIIGGQDFDLILTKVDSLIIKKSLTKVVKFGTLETKKAVLLRVTAQNNSNLMTAALVEAEFMNDEEAQPVFEEMLELTNEKEYLKNIKIIFAYVDRTFSKENGLMQDLILLMLNSKQYKTAFMLVLYLHHKGREGKLQYQDAVIATDIHEDFLDYATKTSNVAMMGILQEMFTFEKISDNDNDNDDDDDDDDDDKKEKYTDSLEDILMHVDSQIGAIKRERDPEEKTEIKKVRMTSLSAPNLLELSLFVVNVWEAAVTPKLDFMDAFTKVVTEHKSSIRALQLTYRWMDQFSLYTGEEDFKEEALERIMEIRVMWLKIIGDAAKKRGIELAFKQRLMDNVINVFQLKTMEEQEWQMQKHTVDELHTRQFERKKEQSVAKKLAAYLFTGMVKHVFTRDDNLVLLAVLFGIAWEQESESFQEQMIMFVMKHLTSHDNLAIEAALLLKPKSYDIAVNELQRQENTLARRKNQPFNLPLLEAVIYKRNIRFERYFTNKFLSSIRSFVVPKIKIFKKITNKDLIEHMYKIIRSEVTHAIQNTDEVRGTKALQMFLLLTKDIRTTKKSIELSSEIMKEIAEGGFDKLLRFMLRWWRFPESAIEEAQELAPNQTTAMVVRVNAKKFIAKKVMFLIGERVKKPPSANFADGGSLRLLREDIGSSKTLTWLNESPHEKLLNAIEVGDVDVVLKILQDYPRLDPLISYKSHVSVWDSTLHHLEVGNNRLILLLLMTRVRVLHPELIITTPRN